MIDWRRLVWFFGFHFGLAFAELEQGNLSPHKFSGAVASIANMYLSHD